MDVKLYPHEGRYCIDIMIESLFRDQTVPLVRVGNAIDPELPDNVLLPKGFTEYIYHVGNVSEVHSIIKSGLIPGGQKSQTRKTIRVLHDSEPNET